MNEENYKSWTLSDLLFELGLERTTSNKERKAAIELEIKKRQTNIDTESETTLKLASRKRRTVAFLIDHFVLTFLMTSIALLTLGTDFLDSGGAEDITLTIIAVLIPGSFIYFSKDSFGGISPGKWIMGVMVRENESDEKTPSFGKLFIRNLSIVIWPVEVIALILNSNKRRLGDILAGAVVLENKNKAKKSKRITALIFIFAVFYGFIFLFVGSAMKDSEAYKIAIQSIEENENIIKKSGGITGYGMLPTGNIRISGQSGYAEFQIKVVGKENDIIVSVVLEKEPGGDWLILKMTDSIIE